MAITDHLGQLVEWYEYSDYGVPMIFAPNGTVRTASAIGNRFLYTVHRWFPELGLYYCRNRWYDPYIQRFLTRDPLGLWGDPMNLGNGTAYVGMNPWTFVDPLGLERCRSIQDWRAKTGLSDRSAQLIMSGQIPDLTGRFPVHELPLEQLTSGVDATGAGKQIAEGARTTRTTIDNVGEDAKKAVTTAAAIGVDFVPVVGDAKAIGETVAAGARGDWNGVAWGVGTAVVGGTLLGMARSADDPAVAILRARRDALGDMRAADRLLDARDAEFYLCRMEMHHLFPKRADLRERFEEAGFNINDYTVLIPNWLHTEIHSGGPRGGQWNQAWQDFFESHRSPSRREILDELARIKAAFGID